MTDPSLTEEGNDQEVAEGAEVPEVSEDDLEDAPAEAEEEDGE